jgi:YVTN family beta-propeller protein
MRNTLSVALLFAALHLPLRAQSTGATFGEIVKLGGTPSDLVLDEARGRLYLVNLNANRVDIYDYLGKKVVGSLPTGSGPVAATMSMDGKYLYVTNNTSSSLSVFDLATGVAAETVSLSVKPSGVEVGRDGRVLITTEGTSTTDRIESLLVYDRSSTLSSQQITAISFAPPPTTPTTLPATTIGRPVTTFRGKLIRTPDGNYIIGMSTVNNNAQTVLFVYEVSSSSILRSRTVTGQSTVLSISPDGARIMAGYTQYNTADLNVVAQQSASNAPFPLSSSGTATFTTVANVGGSIFAPDGDTLYSAFNVAPYSTPAPRPQASTLLISNSRNLGVRLGIKLPESIVARLVITSDGSEAWGLSESGLVYLPLSRLYDYPILQPERTTVFLRTDECNRGLAKFSLGINNLGKGKLTFSVPDATNALTAQATSGVAPSTIEFTMDPGRSTVTRQYGTNLYSGGATNSGTALAVNLSSPDAINVPPTIRVFMNYRQSDQRGVIHPIDTVPTATEGLHDILVDEARDRVYVLNSGYNRIEVFDRSKQKFITPIDVGQLPHKMTMGGDGNTLYVANTGGESVSIVDLNLAKQSGTVSFPALPRSGTSSPVTPQTIEYALFGPQLVMSSGSQWKVVGADATLRPTSTVAPATFNTTTAVKMAGTPDGRWIATLAGNGTIYLYDGMADAYVGSVRPYTSTTIVGYYGPLSAAPDGSYFLLNGFVLNSSLSTIGGSESPSSTTVLPAASKRNVAAVLALDSNRFLRVTTPVKQAVSSTTTSDSRAVLELVDLRDNSISLVGPLADTPMYSLFGTSTRTNVPPRQMAMDASGTAYILGLTGMTVIPVTTSGAGKPVLSTATNNIINAVDGSRSFSPGSFISISGSSLAGAAYSEDLPAPTVLGGSCVTLSDVALPLLQTASGRIVAQVPEALAAGQYVLRIRSLAYGQASEPIVVTVQKR